MVASNDVVKIIIEVRSGVMPNIEREEFHKRWVVTSEEWDSPLREDVLMERLGAATLYFLAMTDPQINNWAKLEWTWL